MSVIFKPRKRGKPDNAEHQQGGAGPFAATTVQLKPMPLIDGAAKTKDKSKMIAENPSMAGDRPPDEHENHKTKRTKYETPKPAGKHQERRGEPAKEGTTSNTGNTRVAQPLPLTKP